MTMSVNAIHDFTGRGETRSATLRIAPQVDEALAGVEAPQQQSFGDMVKEFAGDVNALQFEAGHAIDQFVTGEAADVHQVMVAVEQAAYEDLSDDLGDIQDSVAHLLADADHEPAWVEPLEEIQERLEEIGWELGDLWWRTDMSEQACRTRLWCDKWYDENW